MKSSIWASAAAVLSAAAFSACCWLPVLAVALGVSAGGAAAVFDRYRWFFLLLAVAFLAIGFYLNERRVGACAPDGLCPEPQPGRRGLTRLMLVFSAIVVVLLATLPNYADRLSDWILGEPDILSEPGAALIPLAAEGTELRRDFNSARSKVRLVLLLSPT